MQMGLGLLGDPNIVFKRKFRWTFDVYNICGKGNIGPGAVKVAARPHLEVDETQIDYLNGRAWIPGKGFWNTIQVTYYDLTYPSAGLNTGTADPTLLFTWIRSVYDFGDPINLHMGSRRRDYTGTGILYLFDGCGDALEEWIMEDVWPQSVEFGDLDMSSSDPCEIALTLRFSTVKYTNLCGRQSPPPCCTGCG